MSRWEELFGDLEAQWEAEARRDLDAEVADRTRRERAALGLSERLDAAQDSPLRLRLVAGVTLEGRVSDLGAGWLLLAEDGGRTALVPFTAMVGIEGLAPRVADGGVGRRFGLGYALRGLSRDRAVVALTDVTGAVTTGTVDAVGRDAFDLTEHAPDTARRAGNVLGRRVVPFAALVCLRSA